MGSAATSPMSCGGPWTAPAHDGAARRGDRCGHHGPRDRVRRDARGLQRRAHRQPSRGHPPAIRRIGDLFTGGVKRGKLGEAAVAAAAARLRADRDLGSAVREADVVIEAVVEDLGVKQRLFVELEGAAPADALLATNTSSLSVAAIATGMRRPGRVVGMHFFNPVHAMKLVEVVQPAGAERAAVDRAVELARVFGKEPIVVRDTPGFASSRLGVALGLEAMRMLEQGVASAEDIDKAMELGYNHPMGPLKLTDRKSTR